MKTYGSLSFVSDPKTQGQPLDLFGRSRERFLWRLDDVPPHVAQALKRIFPRIPKAQGAPYFFPATDANAAELEWFMNRYPLLMFPSDLGRLRAGRDSYERKAAEIERIFEEGYTAQPSAGLRPGQSLREPQAQAVHMLQLGQGLLLGDETGLGKTFVGGGALVADGNLPGVVVCEPHLSRQWADVLRAFTMLRVCEVKATTPYRLPEADVYIFRYTQLSGWADHFVDLMPKLVIFDEIQQLRHGAGSDGQPIAKGVAALRLVDVAEKSLGLTATPIFGYGAEIWNVMRYINPDVLGPREDFLREWCSGEEVTDPDALGAFLRDQGVFLRRTKPSRVNKVIHFLTEYEEGAISDVEDMAQALALQARHGAWHERGEATRELDILMRQATGVAKARAVARFNRIIVEGGKPTLLFGWHREVYSIWNEELSDLRPAMYTGSESPARKRIEKARFTTGETDTMFISLRSGSGLDGLQFRSPAVLFGELDWSPAVHHQGIGRADRDGNPIWDMPGGLTDAFFLVVNDGSDPPMMEMNGIKAAQASGIIDPGLGVQTVTADMSRVQALVDRYLERGARL